jgi:hypothetical protein
MTLMTLQNLGRIIDQYESELGSTNAAQFEVLKGLPFYSWADKKLLPNLPNLDIETSSNTSNHAIGLPEKNGQPMPLFDYEKTLFDTLQQHKHVWIKKATGLGVTEFMLRYMAWLCFSNCASAIAGSQMCIVTGPRIELAITLIDRMKGLFANAGNDYPQFDTKETVIELNGIHIEAYPSHHLDAMRGLKDVSFIYLDEADFFPPGQQQDARDVSERYIGKSNPWIVMSSTPNAPDQLFDHIEQEPESTCLYKRLYLDYTYGLGRIYTREEIDAAKASPSFEREYNLKYLGLIGNVFHTRDIEAAMEKAKQRQQQLISINTYTQKSMGLDPGYGSSAFGIVVTEYVDQCINVVYADEVKRADFNQMIELTAELVDRFNMSYESNNRIFVDAANPSFIRALKDRLDDNPEYERQIDHLRTNWGKEVTYNLQLIQAGVFVVPVPFSKEHKHMLAHVKKLMEYADGSIAIHPRFDKLITSLRTAVEKGDGSLDKEATSYDDCFDSFRLSLQFYD